MESTLRPKILITNDDGVSAPGLRALIDAVAPLGEITVVAPNAPRSGQSSAITVDAPLRIIPHPDINGAKVYSVTGTPVDCVKLSMHTLFADHKLDILLSGINHGSNAGNCVVYSGTMGAVFEGCAVGIPSIGFSLLHHSWAADFSMSTIFVRKITEKILSHGLPAGECLNVNIPARCIPKGIKVTRAGKGYWTEEYVSYKDPQGKDFYLLSGHYVDINPHSSLTDTYWLEREYVTVVPFRPGESADEDVHTLEKLF